MHPRLGEFIQYAGMHGLRTYLSANPILLTEKKITELVDCGLHELVLSLDGVSAETCTAVRGRAARDIEKAERRINALLKYRHERNSKTPSVIMQFVRQKLNQHETKTWLKKWTNVEGVDAVKMKSFVTWDGQNERINALRIEQAVAPEKIICDKPWTSVTILWDGRVVPCCFDYDGFFVLGNLNDQSFEEICNGTAIRALRQAHREHNLKDIRLCSRCIDKEGYHVAKWYYPFNRLLLRRTPLGDVDLVEIDNNAPINL